MPIGANAGGNLNAYLFEVGMLITDPVTGREQAITIAMHPLLTVPSSITYRSASRSPVARTSGGALKTNSGRDLMQVTMAGTFGVESRGIGPVIGSGEVRGARFRREVVELGEALFRRDVDAALRAITTSPGARAAASLFNESTCSFFVNFYDFWESMFFQVHVPTYQWVRKYGEGGASGLYQYQLNLVEVGPLVTGGLGSAIMQPLFRGLQLWDDINDVIESYDVATLENALIAVPNIVLTELVESVTAVRAQLDGVGRLMGSSPSAQSDATLGAFFTNSQALARAAGGGLTQLGLRATGEVDNEPGQINWVRAPLEGVIAELDYYARIEELDDLMAAAEWQLAAGALFGMSPTDYQQYIAAGGALTGTQVSGSITHVVTDFDSAATIEERYGVTWLRVLEVNDMLPDEALAVGVALQIPAIRAPGPQPIAGLPTFGSHVGEAAWGSDVTLDLAAAADGKPEIVTGTDALVQGVQFIVETFGDEIIGALPVVVPGAQTAFLEQRLEAALLSDRRFLGLSRVDVSTDPSGAGLEIDVTAEAINGGTVRTGAA